MKGFRITRQGLRLYHDELVRRTDPRGNPISDWRRCPDRSGRAGYRLRHADSGYVSITPLQLDLTSQTMAKWMQSRHFEDNLTGLS